VVSCVDCAKAFCEVCPRASPAMAHRKDCPRSHAMACCTNPRPSRCTCASRSPRLAVDRLPTTAKVRTALSLSLSPARTRRTSPPSCIDERAPSHSSLGCRAARGRRQLRAVRRGPGRVALHRVRHQDRPLRHVLPAAAQGGQEEGARPPAHLSAGRLRTERQGRESSLFLSHRPPSRPGVCVSLLGPFATKCNHTRDGLKECL
jgi:hypothetical protein